MCTVHVTYLHTYIKHTHTDIQIYIYILYIYNSTVTGEGPLTIWVTGPCRSRTPKTSPAGFRAWRLERCVVGHGAVGDIHG